MTIKDAPCLVVGGGEVAARKGDLIRQALEDEAHDLSSSMKSIYIQGGVVDSMKIAQCKRKAEDEPKSKKSVSVNVGEDMKFKNAPRKPLNRKRSGLRRGHPEDNNKKKKHDVTPSAGQVVVSLHEGAP